MRQLAGQAAGAANAALSFLVGYQTPNLQIVVVVVVEQLLEQCKQIDQS